MKLHYLTILGLCLAIGLQSSAAQEKGNSKTLRSRWSVAADRFSQMDDKRVVEITDKALTSLTDRSGESERPVLALRCEGPKLSIMVYTGVLPEVYPMRGASYGAANVRFKFDGEDPIREEWLLLNNSYWVEPQEGYTDFVLPNLVKSRTLLFEFTQFESGSHVVKFDLTGLGTFLSRLRKACPDISTTMETPVEAPDYPGATRTSADIVRGRLVIKEFETPDSVAQVVSFYKEKMGPRLEVTQPTSPGGEETLNYSVKDFQTIISVSGSKREGEKTKITISRISTKN